MQLFKIITRGKYEFCIIAPDPTVAVERMHKWNADNAYPITGADIELAYLELIADESLHIDEICVQSHQNIDKISATLVIMELKGLVRQDGNMNFQAIMEPTGLYDPGDDEV